MRAQHLSDQLPNVTVAVIMMIIGSNIARAFSLVGALSIIRFRSAIKDPRDVAFLFAFDEIISNIGILRSKSGFKNSEQVLMQFR